MPFSLPELASSTWIMIAAGGMILALLVPRFAPLDSRFAGRLMFIIFFLAGICGMIGVMKWARVIP